MTAQEFLKAMKWDKESALKSLPDFYGIEGVKFKYLNNYEDPHLIWKGIDIGSCYTVEDTMWQRFREENVENEIQYGTEDEECEVFGAYMKNSADAVKELCDLVLEGRIKNAIRTL